MPSKICQHRSALPQDIPAPKPFAIEHLPAPRLFVVGARSSSRATRRTSRRPPPPLPLTRGINRKPLATRAQRTRPTFKCTNAQRGRPRGRDGQLRRFHALHTGLAARQASKSVAPRSGGPDGGRPRLRSGAFAPDFPFVIFVTAFGCSFRFPRAHLHAPRTAGQRRPGLDR